MTGSTIAELRAEGMLFGHGRCRHPAAGRAGRGQGSGDAVPPVPSPGRHRRRHAPRARDALHRRGDGHRRLVRPGVREVADRVLRLAADHGHGVRLGRQHRQARPDQPGETAVRHRFHHRRHRRHRGDVAPQRDDVSRWCKKHFEGSRNIVETIRAGEIDLVINTPYGQSGPRIDGYEIRTAAVGADIPCITTVAGAAAAIQGIEALIRSHVGVASLQNLQARLRTPGRRGAAAPPQLMTRYRPSMGTLGPSTYRTAGPARAVPARARRRRDRAPPHLRWLAGGGGAADAAADCGRLLARHREPADRLRHRVPVGRRARRRGGQGRRRAPGLACTGFRLHRGREPSPRGRNPATRGHGCSGSATPRRWSTGWASTTTASAALADRLAALGPIGIPVGISLGKSKVTPVDDAVDDYLTSLPPCTRRPTTSPSTCRRRTPRAAVAAGPRPARPSCSAR